MTEPQTGPQTEHQPGPPPSAQTRSEQKFELSPAQVTGSALAAMSGAFLASYLGTAGTIIGAVVGSLVATIGTAAYTWWLRRTSEAVKRTATQVRETGMGSTVVVPLLPGKRGPGSKKPGTQPGRQPGTPAAPEQEPEDLPGETDRWAWARNRPWGKVALVAAGIALAVLAGLTVLESITGKPLSSYTKGGDETGTSVSHLGRKDPTPSPSPTPPSRSSTPTPSPSPAQTGLTPTPVPTPSPSPSGLPTETTTPTPSPTPSVGTTTTP